MVADYAIGQFRFLERLLLVHGHWCYRRISLMVCRLYVALLFLAFRTSSFERVFPFLFPCVNIFFQGVRF